MNEEKLRLLIGVRDSGLGIARQGKNVRNASAGLYGFKDNYFVYDKGEWMERLDKVLDEMNTTRIQLDRMEETICDLRKLI